MRNPLEDPLPGDVVQAENGKYRIVKKRHGDDIDYTTSPDGPQRNCWISTWYEWCRKVKAQVTQQTLP